MKKYVLLAVAMLLSIGAWGQARKPKLMIVPAATWCNQNGYVTEYENALDGNVVKVPDYQKAFDENEYISMIIGAMQDFMRNEDYDVIDLKSTLNKLRNRAARDNSTAAGGGIRQSPIDELNKTAKSDINVEVHYSIKKDGPYKYVEFNVSAVDPYCNKPVSTGNMGRGTSAASTQVVNQLEEAVLSFKDKFCGDMDRYYNSLFDNGRPIVIRCTLAENADVDYETEYDGEELSTLIEDWVASNAMKGNYSLEDKTENEVYFDDVRIPMTYTDPRSGETRGSSADSFARSLRRYIESTTGLKCKSDMIGSGEVNIILGGKS
ncbi:MAG: hypothetical protein K2K82_03860 [Muribaculaceae bacterium]|nr:hypothetical protein [Muribaculaceae bacterium]